MPKKAHILLFDSGAGGLSVCTDIINLIPNVQITYIADIEAFPYGNRHENDIVERLTTHLFHAVQAVSPDIIVIACNTASTIALPQLRALLKQPIVGVVPAIKPAALASVTGVIGVLATPGTVVREYTRALIGQYAKEKTVLLHGSDVLVALAEEKVKEQPPDRAAIQKELHKMLDHPEAKRMDVLVLACTHFPLIRNDIVENVRAGTQVLDSGDAIARRVKHLLGDISSNIEPTDKPNSTTCFKLCTLTLSHTQDIPKDHYHRFLTQQCPKSTILMIA